MFGMELTTGQKVQIGFVVAVLGISGIMLYHNTRPVPNNAITVWSQPHPIKVDPSKPLSRDNPYDPNKEQVYTIFASQDGKLRITEFPHEPAKKPLIEWAEIDKRRKSYIYYTDPMAPVKAVTDPYKHAIALAAYNAANGRSLGLLNSAALTKDQLDEEKKARDIMMNALAVTKMQVADGAFHPELFNLVLDALKAYRNVSGDPLKDQKKADAARKVLELAAAYLKRVELEKQKDIEKYISKMSAILSAEQRVKVAEAGRIYESGTMRLAVAPRVTPPAGAPVQNRAGQNRANNANRAGAPTTNRANRANQNSGQNPGTAAPVRNVELTTPTAAR